MNAKALRHPVVIIGIAVALAAILIALRPEPEIIIPEQKPLLVDVLQVEPGTLAISVKAQGVVQPSSQTSLVSEVAGRIIEVSDNFNAGGFARSGDVLLRIDPRDYEARLQQAEAQVAQAKSLLAQERGRAEVARHEWKQRAGRDKISADAKQLALREPQLLEAEAQLESAQAALQQAQIDLERTVIVAPYDGLVTAKNADIGQYITTGVALGQIMAVGDAEVRLPIPEGKLDYLSLPSAYGLEGREPASVDLSYRLDGTLHEWQAELVRTEGILDDRSRSLFVIARLADPYGVYRKRKPGFTPLRFGMFVNAQIEGREVEDVIALPRGIVRPGNKVWIVDDSNRLREREVSLLRTDGSEIFVTDGLDAGDKVCLTSVGPVLPGTKVSISSVVRQNDGAGASDEMPATDMAKQPRDKSTDAALTTVPVEPNA